MNKFLLSLFFTIVCAQSVLVARYESSDELWLCHQDLWQIVADQKDEVIELFATDPSQFFVRDKNDLTLLHRAVIERDILMVENILTCACCYLAENEYFDFINQVDKVCGWTPLHIAAALAFTEIQATLINAQVNANIRDKHGLTPSQLAAQCPY